MKALVLVMCVALSGCALFQKKETEVVTRTQYVVRTASPAQKALPPQPTPIDVTKATQLELADWIVRTEKRMLDLESIIARLVEFYEKPVTEAEKPKEEKKPEAK